jgi:putative metallohydrolase (TIGR04338 family)
MSKTRDNQRAKIYRAEREGLGGLSYLFKDLKDVNKYIDYILRSSYWKKLNGSPYIDVRDGRGRRSACAFNKHTIALPRWARTDVFVLHELTHTVVNFNYTKVADHGREFAKEFLGLVKRFMGKECYLILKESYKKNHVHYTKVATE